MELYFDMMGFDWVAYVDYRVTSWGSADSWTEPGDSIQIEVDHIWISLDKGRKIKTPSFEITGGLFDAIYERIQEKLYEKVNEDGPPEFEDDWR